MARRADLKGRETPRLFTPPLRPLTEQTTLGFLAIVFAEQVLGLTLFPWQKWLLLHALELDPALTVDTMDARGPLDPLFRFRKIVVLVARQNGKSTLSQVLSLFFMYVLGTGLVLGTAQDLDTAEEVWEGALELIETTPELAGRALKPSLRNGNKAIRLKSGERYKVKAANRKAGRGLSGDLILLDEIREHRNWEAWGAITKTTMARPAAQIWALSNAGDATSVVLRYLRKTAHAALGDPDGVNAADDPSLLLPDDSDGLSADEVKAVIEDADADEQMGGGIGLFEWSAAPDLPVDDLDGLAQANPSLGYGISLATLLSDARDDPEWVFRTECLCQWSDGALEGVFPTGSWQEQADETSSVAPGNRVVMCVAMSWDRSRTSVAIAGERADGRTHVGILASRSGSSWLADWLNGPDSPPADTIVIQRSGAPESSLIEELERAGFTITEWGGPDLAKAHGAFYDVVAKGAQGHYRHRTQPLTEVAVATAVTKPLGEAWVLDVRKSAGDVAPLKAIMGAAWGLSNVDTRVSAYEDDDAYGMMVL